MLLKSRITKQEKIKYLFSTMNNNIYKTRIFIKYQYLIHLFKNHTFYFIYNPSSDLLLSLQQTDN